jgi:DNA-binding PadR family transcriptional regulator
MEIVDFPNSIKKLIIETYYKKTISSDSQSIFSKFSFYIATSDLRKYGLLEPNGNFKGGEVKEWKLTEKGKKLAKLLIEINSLMDGIKK